MICTVDSPIGLLTIKADGDRLTEIDLLSSEKFSKTTLPRNDFVRTIRQQFHDYFSNPHSQFKLAYQLQGTDFQKRVWKAMLKIPEGEVMTYGELAKKLNSSPRAVGNACRANPLPVLIPCHRVVSQSGIGGYAGKTSGPRLAVKRWLLLHEGAMVKGL